jgi:hypothetical protein
MNRTAAGVFDTYSAAGKVVRELELLGISGEQVEVVREAAHDVRGEGAAPQEEDQDESLSNGKYTLVIVRPSDDVGMEQAKRLMDRYGAKLFRWQISADGAPIDGGSPGTTPNTEIGGPGTTGSDPHDLPGRGVEFKVHGEGPSQDHRERQN